MDDINAIIPKCYESDVYSLKNVHKYNFFILTFLIKVCCVHHDVFAVFQWQTPRIHSQPFITSIRSHVQNNNLNFKTGDQKKQSRQSICHTEAKLKDNTSLLQITMTLSKSDKDALGWKVNILPSLWNFLDFQIKTRK